jgi:DNA polymerase-4
MNTLYGNEVDFAYKLKDNIYKKFGFTVNIGIGNNKLSAKMASDFEKPNKVHTLYTNEIQEKIWPLAIGNLFGC